MAITLLQSGCATESPIIKKNGNYQVQSRIWFQDSLSSAKKYAYIDAEKVCADKNLEMEAIRAGDTYDSIGWVYIVEFTCYDRTERLKANQLEAERQRVIQVEKERIAEQERKRYEDEQKAKEAERLRLEALKEAERLRQEKLKEAEWERTRPQREAAKRKALAEEEARLNSICPTYYVVRQTCAAAVWYGDCMKYRYGKNYSISDDNACFYR